MLKMMVRMILSTVASTAKFSFVSLSVVIFENFLVEWRIFCIERLAMIGSMRRRRQPVVPKPRSR